MKTFWKILLSIAFGIILLEALLLIQTQKWFELTNLRIASMASLGVLIYHFIFRSKKKDVKR